MKTYEVELKRESYITYTVEASSPEEAEDLAWKELQRGYADDHCATWDIEHIAEVTA